nr:terminase small subunit [Acuticoccus kalidii]
MTIPATVSARVLANLFGVSPQTIQAYAARGVIVRQGRGSYPLAENVQRYTRHLRDAASGRGADEATSSLTDERTRLARERADEAALKNAKLRREMLPREEVLARWSTILRNVSARMRAVPSRVRAQRPHLTREDVDLIDEEIRLALTEAAENA